MQGSMMTLRGARSMFAIPSALFMPVDVRLTYVHIGLNP